MNYAETSTYTLTSWGCCFKNLACSCLIFLLSRFNSPLTNNNSLWSGSSSILRTGISMYSDALMNTSKTLLEIEGYNTHNQKQQTWKEWSEKEQYMNFKQLTVILFRNFMTTHGMHQETEFQYHITSTVTTIGITSKLSYQWLSIAFDVILNLITANRCHCLPTRLDSLPNARTTSARPCYLDTLPL